MTLRKLHACSASLVGAFIFVHIANHLVGLAGVDAHLGFMEAGRVLYRIPVVEGVLLAAVAFQIVSGIALAIRGWKQRSGVVPWIQVCSGACIALFLLNHVGAVLSGRAVTNLDTNFYFAAAGLHVPPFHYFFAPYYFLAVLAVFVHIGCALHWRVQQHHGALRMLALIGPAAVGLIVSLLIVSLLAGMLYPVEVPPEYATPYSRR